MCFDFELAAAVEPEVELEVEPVIELEVELVQDYRTESLPDQEGWGLWLWSLLMSIELIKQLHSRI